MRDQQLKMCSRLLRFQSGPPSAVLSTLPVLSVCQRSLCLRLQKRFITAKERPLPEADTSGPGPNQEQLPHVSEEAAATGKITGQGGPDIEQGTPVQEVRPRRVELDCCHC
jgi:small subunit ribosomal protein S7